MLIGSYLVSTKLNFSGMPNEQKQSNTLYSTIIIHQNDQFWPLFNLRKDRHVGVEHCDFWWSVGIVFYTKRVALTGLRYTSSLDTMVKAYFYVLFMPEKGIAYLHLWRQFSKSKTLCVQPKNAFGQCTVKILPYFGLLIRPDNFTNRTHYEYSCTFAWFFLSYVVSDKKCFTLIIIPKRWRPYITSSGSLFSPTLGCHEFDPFPLSHHFVIK